MLSSMPPELQTFIDSCDSVLIVELSYSGQFHQYLRTQVDLPRKATNLYSRSGGKALSASEVVTALRPLLIATHEEVLV